MKILAVSVVSGCIFKTEAPIANGPPKRGCMVFQACFCFRSISGKFLGTESKSLSKHIFLEKSREEKYKGKEGFFFLSIVCYLIPFHCSHVENSRNKN